MRLDSVSYSAYVGDHRDCCVRALSVAANRPYDECYRLMARHGRKPNRGTYPRTSRAAYAEAGLDAVTLPVRLPDYTGAP